MERPEEVWRMTLDDRVQQAMLPGLLNLDILDSVGVLLRCDAGVHITDIAAPPVFATKMASCKRSGRDGDWASVLPCVAASCKPSPSF